MKASSMKQVFSIKNHFYFCNYNSSLKTNSDDLEITSLPVVLSEPGSNSILNNGIPNAISKEISDLVSLNSKLSVVPDQKSNEIITWRKLVIKSLSNHLMIKT